MTNEEKQFEQIVAGLNIDDRPNAEHKKALRQQMLAACKDTASSKTAPRIQPDWSRIMKSKAAQGAIAAMVIIGVFFGIYQITGSIDGANIVFADVIEAMKDVPWLHQTSQGFQGDVSGTAEQWLGFEAKIHAAKWADGKRTFWDINQQKRYEYDPEKSDITIEDTSGTEVPFSIASPTAMVEGIHEMLVEQGAEVITESVEYNGRKAQLQQFAVSLTEQSQLLKLYIDPESKRLVAAEINAKDSDGNVLMDGTATFSYPETGPGSIYELGVPSTAKVFDQTEMKQAKKFFAAGDVKGLAALFEAGNTETKLAVANYLADLGTEEAAEALKTLDVSDEDPALQGTVADILENMRIPFPGENTIDPNLPDTVSGETEYVDTGTEEFYADANNDQEGYLGIQVIDAVSGKAIEGALLKMRSNLNGDSERTTNQFGRATYAIDADKASYLTVKITAKGYVSKYLDWRPASKGIAIPKQYQVQMKKSVPVGGYVKTKEGSPIEDVSVNIYTEFTTQYTEFDYIQETVKTDKDGRWYFEDFDPDALRPYFSLSHPKYVSTEQSSIRPNIELLLNQTSVMFMQPGLTVSGHILTQDGKPFAGAVVYEGWSRFSEDNKSITDNEGYYQFEKCYEGSMVLTVTAKGFAPDMKEINVHENLDNVDFKLTPGHTLPLRILDRQDNPIGGVKVEARYWRTFNRGQKCESIRCSGITGMDGRVVLEDLPPDEVQYSIRKDGYAAWNNFPIIPSEEEVVMTLWPQGKLIGGVYDAETGEAVNDFTMTEGIHWQGQDKPTWQTHVVKHFVSGRYELPFTYHNEGYAVRIEAPGYQTFDSESMWNEGEDVTLDIYLENIDQEQMLGVVYDPDGQPAANADVLVALKGGGHWLRIENGRFDQTSHLRLITNPEGEFILPPQQQEYVIIVLHESGVSRVSEEEFMAASEVIQLEKWGHIEGTVYSGRNPDVNCEISVQSRYDLGFSYEYNIIDYTNIYSDDQGHFEYHRIPPGPVSVVKVVKLDNNSSSYTYRTSIEVLPGETKEIHLGGGGRTVTGRLLPPVGINISFPENNFDIMPSESNLRENGLDLSTFPEIPLPEDYFLQTQEQMQAWQTEWMQTSAGQEYVELAQKLSGNVGNSIRGDYPIVIDEKGNFEITDVLPGNYIASGRFRDPALNLRSTEYLNTYIAGVKFEFTVENAEDKEEFDKPLNIGPFTVQPLQSLQIGLLPPDIAIKNMDGNMLTLNNYQGRYVLLDLGGLRYLTNQNQEERETVKQIYTAYHQECNLDVISIISGSSFPLSWPSVQRAFRYLFNRKEIDWTVAFEDTASFLPSALYENYSINGKPARYVLIGPDQKVAEIIMDESELLEKIKKHLGPQKNNTSSEISIKAGPPTARLFL